MRSLLKGTILSLVGGITYVFIEILYRGYSHWSMFLLGGLCFLLIGLINEIFPWDMSIIIQSVIGSGIVTLLEFITGVFVNIIFKMDVWDYSNVPFNLLGQICLPFSLIWIVVSCLAIILDDILRWKLFGEEKPHYKL